MIVISANNLTKEYDGTNLVLDKVSFAVNKGERIGIIGINGAGKTTLLRMLAGQLPQEGGDFFIYRTVIFVEQLPLFCRHLIRKNRFQTTANTTDIKALMLLGTLLREKIGLNVNIPVVLQRTKIKAVKLL